MPWNVTCAAPLSVRVNVAKSVAVRPDPRVIEAPLASARAGQFVGARPGAVALAHDVLVEVVERHAGWPNEVASR